MMKKLSTCKKFVLQVLWMIPVFVMCCFVYGDETIELEVGYDALEEYKTFNLEPGQYVSLDESIVTVNQDGLVTAKRFGETEIQLFLNDELIKTIPVIVYWVGDEPIPWGSVNLVKSYISGYPGQIFKPKNFISRAEVATMFVKLMNLSYDKAESYLDLTPDHWAYDYIQSINFHHLMAPRSENEFYPDALLTKGEFALLIANYASYQGFHLNETPKYDVVDVSINMTAYKAIHQLLNVQIFQLKDGCFEPESFISRGEVVKIINSIIERKPFSPSKPFFKDVDPSNPYYDAIYSAFY